MLLAAWIILLAFWLYLFFGLHLWPFGLATLLLAVFPVAKELRGWLAGLVGAVVILVVGVGMAVAAIRPVPGLVVTVMTLIAALATRPRTGWQVAVAVAASLAAVHHVLTSAPVTAGTWFMRSGLYIVAVTPLLVAVVSRCTVHRR